MFPKGHLVLSLFQGKKNFPPLSFLDYLTHYGYHVAASGNSLNILEVCSHGYELLETTS